MEGDAGMKPIPMQGIDDCWRACLATILEVDYEDVPYFGRMDDPESHKDWLEKSLEFLGGFGLNYIEFQKPEDEVHRNQILRGYHIIVGKSKIFPDFKHAVVAKDGLIVWDPNPREGAGIVPGTETYGVFIAMNPAEMLITPRWEAEKP